MCNGPTDEIAMQFLKLKYLFIRPSEEVVDSVD